FLLLRQGLSATVGLHVRVKLEPVCNFLQTGVFCDVLWSWNIWKITVRCDVRYVLPQMQQAPPVDAVDRAATFYVDCYPAVLNQFGDPLFGKPPLGSPRVRKLGQHHFGD